MNGAALRKTLIDRALDLLDNGADALSLRAVARAANVSAMAPYRHFADRSALLRAVAGEGFDRLRVALSAADAAVAGDPRSALIAQGLAYVAFADAHPALFRLMFADLEGIDADGCATPAYTVLADRVASLAPADPASATVAAWAIVHGMATLVHDRRLSGDADMQRSALTLLVDGIARRG